jgi:hypothetical protein
MLPPLLQNYSWVIISRVVYVVNLYNCTLYHQDFILNCKVKIHPYFVLGGVYFYKYDKTVAVDFTLTMSSVKNVEFV